MSRDNQRKESAVAFLEAAVDYSTQLGVRVERAMKDNGSCYRCLVLNNDDARHSPWAPSQFRRADADSAGY
jgi:hypothetical protein